MMEACRMCYNARLDDELTDENDFSAVTIGDSVSGYRLMLCSGYGIPPRIEVDKWRDDTGWYNIGRYYFNYCPNCGRKIIEYEITT